MYLNKPWNSVNVELLTEDETSFLVIAENKPFARATIKERSASDYYGMTQITVDFLAENGHPMHKAEYLVPNSAGSITQELFFFHLGRRSVELDKFTESARVPEVGQYVKIKNYGVTFVVGKVVDVLQSRKTNTVHAVLVETFEGEELTVELNDIRIIE